MKQEIDKYKDALKKAAGKIQELSDQIAKEKTNEDIAIIGCGCRFPGGANNPELFWEILKNGVDTVIEIPENRFPQEKYYSENQDEPGKMYTKSGAFLNIPIDRFDNKHFEISPVEVSSIDPQHRLLLEVSWEALENAGLNIEKLKGSRTGVFIAINSGEYSKAHLFSGDVNDIGPYSMTGISYNAACGRLSYFYDLKGPSASVDTACSSSLVALNMAVQSLKKNECEMAIVGGVNMMLTQESFISMCKIHALSPDGRCKTFDAKADGYGRGEGCGVVVLKRLTDAQADRNMILAVVKSVFIGQDGRTNGFTAPNGISQKNVIRQALERAALSPDDIDYIEAHGAGTELGDLIEVSALSDVFKNRNRNLFIGTVKTNIGHTEAASGMAGLIKVILAIHNKRIPPHLHFHTPNPNINWKNIEVVTALTDWNNPGRKRRAGISSFGFTGTLAHAIIEEPPPDNRSAGMQELPYHLLTLSAKDEYVLQAAVNSMQTHLLETGDSINDICFTANIAKSYLDHRFAVSGATKADILKDIEDCWQDPQKYSEITSDCHRFPPAKIAFLFTGQGSIYQDIGRRFYETSPVFKEALELCDQKFQSLLDISILKVMFAKENTALLHSAIYSQPVIFAIEYSLSRIWESLGIKPGAVIGHSIGEYTAACVAGLLSVDDAIKMIAHRGKIMDSVAENGRMAGVLTGEAAVRQTIRTTGCQNVSVAAVNAPNNVTISGLNGEVDRVLEKIQEERVFIDKLNISHPFHSVMMEPYTEDYYNQIKDISYAKPKINIISTVTGQLEDEGAIGNTRYWANHLCNTVKFLDAVKTADQMGYNVFIEIGGNATLSGLAAQCLAGEDYLFIPTLRQGVNEYKQLLDSAASLYLRGVELDWNSFYANYSQEKVSLPGYPFQRKSFWIDLQHNPGSRPESIKVPGLTRFDNQNRIPVITERGSTRPVNDREQIKSDLKQIIHLISGLETDEIRDDANLFSLGFDSLLLIQFKKRIDGKYGFDISLNQFLMELNTVTRIGDYIHEHLPESALAETAVTALLPESDPRLDYTPNNEFESFVGNQIANISQQLEYIKNSIKQKYQPATDSPSRKTFPKINSRSMIFAEDRLTPAQNEFIKNFTARYNEKTKRSKEYTVRYSPVLSDWIGSLNFRTTLKELLYPVVSSRSQGARFWDVDGNEYIDLAIGYGVNFFGHNPGFIREAINDQLARGYELGPQSELAGKVAELIKELTGVERVAFCNTGSEAVMVAVRIARATRKLDKIVLFAGSYHGTFDGVLAQTDDEGPFPISSGTPYNMVEDTITLMYGSQESLDYIGKHHQEIAAVLVEPVQSRRPGFQPKAFLTELRDLTAQTGIVLIFDEMINGFRIHPGGAQAHFGIRADIVTYGKIVGGGMPIGVIAGKKEYLDAADGGSWNFGDSSKPDHETVTFAGTFCKHPLTMAAAYAALSYMKQEGESLQQTVNARTESFVQQTNQFFELEKAPIRMRHFGSQFRFESYGQYDLSLFPIEMDLFFYLLMYKGVYTWERRICAFCTEITPNDIEIIIQKIRESIHELRAGGFSFYDYYSPINDAPNFHQSLRFPLSTSQKRLYMLIQIDNKDPYHIVSVMKIKGQLDTQKLTSVFKTLIRRHESLRTQLFVDHDELYQEILPEADFEIEIIPKEPFRDLDEFIAEVIGSFDLAVAPLVKVKVIEIANAESVLVIDLHHTIADGFSLNILAQEFMKLYADQPLDPVKKQYGDYVLWEKDFLASTAFKKCESYWLQKMAGDLIPLDLPLDYPRPAMMNYSGNTVTMKIEPEIVTALKNLAQKTETSLFMVLISAFTILLQKLSGREEILVGTPTSNRSQGNYDQSVGMFTNTIVLRNYPANHKSYRGFLNEVKQNCLEAYSYMDYPFNLLVNKSNVKRDISRNPVFDAMFIYENANDRVFEIAGLEIETYDYKSKTAMFDFTLEILEERSHFNVNLNYRADLFKEATIGRWGQYYKRLLGLLTLDPDTLISSLQLISEAEKNQLIYQFNQTKSSYPHEKLIQQLFEEQVERTPDQMAVVCEAEELTYQELNRKANQLARFLQKGGVGPNNIIGIMVERSLEMIIAIIAILKAGGAYLPIDPEYPEERIKYMLEDSKTTIVLTQKEFASKGDFLSGITKINLKAEEVYRRSGSNLKSASRNKAHDLAYVIYTSGSTGNPKGVMIEHRAVHNFIRGIKDRIEFTTGKTILAVTTISFDIFGLETLLSLTQGLRVIIATESEQQNPQLLSKLITKQRIQMLQLTPSRMRMLLADNNHQSCLGHLTEIMIGGEVVPESLVIEIRKLTQARIYNMYGPTETTIWSTVKDITSDTAINIGTPISNTQIYITDRNYRPQPIGVIGELGISGDGLARGYLNQYQLTEEKFTPNPFEPGGRMYRTGDLARWLPDGNIEFLGRIDYQVKIRGFRIELGEIESRLLTHEAIKEAVVVASENQTGDKSLCAYIVAEKELTVVELRDYLGQALPEYMIPSYFVQLPKMPLNQNGKVDRKALPEPDGTINTGTEYVAPADEIEAKLAEIWREVLGVERVGVNDNFFELGGHSLKATILALKIHQACNVEVPLREIFQKSTVRELASYIAQAGKNIYAAIEPAPPRKYYPVSSAQKRLLLLDQFESGSTLYNIPVILLIEGEVVKPALERAFQNLIKRHESLRTCFEFVDGEPVERILPAVEFAIAYGEAERSDINQVIAEFVKPFDLKKPPLLRVKLVSIDVRQYLLMFDMHHIISDGTSMGILIRELTEMYQGKELLPLRIQYKDYAVWQNEILKTGSLKPAENYWLERFQGELPVLNLPLDYPRPVIQSFEGSSLEFMIEPELTGRLRKLAARTNTTLFMVLLAGYNVLLSRYTGQEDIIIGSPIAGRPHADLRNIIGMFVNTLALRNYPVGTKSFTKFLADVKQSAIEAYEYQDYQFEELVEKAQVSRDLSRNPLFDVMFALQNMELKTLEIPGLKLKPYEYESRTAKFDLTLSGQELADGISFNLEYCGKLFTKGTIHGLIDHYQNVLREITLNPSQRLSEFAIIAERERQQLLYEFNDNATGYPKEKTIPELFEEQVERTPDNIAVVYQDEKLTYRELNRKANQLAGRLRDKGVKPDNLVGMMVERSLEMIIGIMAILKSGGAYLPIDPEFPEERVKYLLADGRVKLLLTTGNTANAAHFDGQIIHLDDAQIYQGTGINLVKINNSADLAYVMYTSGSTGHPKGTLITHYNIGRVVKDVNYIELTAQDNILQLSNYAFDGSTFDIFGSLLNGSRLVMLSKEHVLEMNRLLDIIQREKITVFFITTALFNTLIDIGGERLTGVRKILFGGERVSVQHVHKGLQLLGKDKLIHVYGPTESTVYATYYFINEIDYNANNIPIGRPLSNIRIYIISKTGSLQPIGVPGELGISGDGLARGYLNQYQLTEEKFTPNPFEPGGRMYRTGDLARWLPDGNIEFLGRIDYQVKIRGFRIELGEIESRLLTHEAIKEAVAVASENQTGDKSLCAYIVAEKELTVVELRDYLGQALPEYMIPSYFVQLPKMPLNQNGKVDRKALPEPDGTINTGTEYVAPADEIEAKLAEIWREVLGVERVGVNDNFFELGGDSIKAIQIIARLKKYQLDLEIKNLFLYQIIKELKHHIRQDRGLIIDQGIVTGEIELTPIQEWFFKQKIANSHHFNQAIILCNRNGFDKSSVQEVFMKLWEHHDALRTVYRAGENRVSQYIRGIDEGELLTIKETDLTGKPELKERIAAEMNELHQSFDLAKGPLVKVKLFKTGEKDYLGMVIHHLIVDGVSWRILLEDFTIGYGQALNGEEIRFQSKTSSFKDWASRLREYATRQEILQELSYWSMLAREETLELPVDRDVTVNKNKDSEELQIELTAEETGKLLTKVNQAYNTEINDILLAALGLAVKEWTGADKILLNLEGHGREQILEGIDITRTVGWFTSIYPVILDLKQTGDLSHTIKSIKESLRRIPCRGIGYGILKYLTPEGQRPGFGFNKEPEISFNYLGEIGQENNQAGDIQMADISSGIAVSLDAKRFYKLDINGVIIGKKLTVNFSYNRHQYRRKTIAEVANHYRRYLIKIIEHCLSKPESGLTAPGLNPLWQKTIPVAEDLTGRITTQTNNKLENQLRAYLRKYDAPGMIVGIQPVNEKPWIFALGKADIHNNIAMNRDTCFKIGSITKTFITTIILQFVEEGRIKLDDPITAYLPETLIYKYSGYNLAGIRIRQLLNHTNGIPDFANNPDFKKLVLADNYKLWKPGELLAYGFLASPNKFSPGNDSWLYSSTGFILLGIIIENLTKISLKDNIQVRICDKLGFSHTRLLDVSPDLNNFSRCYTSDEKKDMTSFGLFAFWAAGGMISNAENLLIWLDAYLSGKLLRNNQMMFDYIDISKCFPIDNQIKVGLGIFNINGMQGHEGHGPGFQNILYRYRDVDFIIHINQDKTDPNSITSSDAFDIFNDLKNLVG